MVSSEFDIRNLPFYFDYLYEFYEDVKYSNRIWSNVKYIDLSVASTYDFYFLKQLKMKMAKLIFINFSSSVDINHIKRNVDEREKNRLTLDNVTTTQRTGTYFQDRKEFESFHFMRYRFTLNR